MSIDRATAIKVLREHLTDELVVAGLGNPSYDLFNAGDRPEHFYMWGAMGLAPSVGLGAALAAPDSRVIAMEGDGGVLMNMGALASIGALSPSNLVVLVWDNRGFDLTGGQPTASTAGADLVAVARGCGIQHSERVSDLDDFRALIPSLLEETGPWCLVIDTGPTPPDRVKPLVQLRRRFVRLESFTDAAESQRVAARRGDAR